MKLANIVAWYQKKIGTYDKQQWEKTVEQRILNGFIHVPLKNTRLKTELIDVDLVRGSSFPKAKPKQGLLTVFKLSLSRSILFPLHAKWWVKQTSPLVFVFLLIIYVLQMINWAIYSYNVQKVSEQEHIVSIVELLVPLALSLILCTIHSQIVATSSVGQPDEKRKRSVQHSKKRSNWDPAARRKKKTIRIRSTENKQNLNSKTHHKSALNAQENLTIFSNNLTGCSNADGSGKPTLTATTTTTCDVNVVNSIKTVVVKENDEKQQLSNKNKPDQLCVKSVITDINRSPSGLRKRNVNWNLSDNREAQNVRSSENRQLERSINAEVENMQATQHIANENVFRRRPIVVTGDDDGFESLNGKSSSGEETVTVQQLHQIDSNDIHLHLKKNPEIIENIENNSNLIVEDVIQNNENTNLKSTPAVVDGRPLFKKRIRNQSDSTETDEEGDDGETLNNNSSQFTEATTSATEWIGITTNSEDCSSDLDHSASQYEHSENGGEFDFTPSVILNPICGNSDRINCTIWDGRETKKAEMSVLDISSAIIERVEAMPESCDYVYIGIFLSLMLSTITALCRLCETAINTSSTEVNFFDMPGLLLEKASFSTSTVIRFAFGKRLWENAVLLNSLLLRIFLTFLFFFVLAVAEKTFKQRFLYAKLFSHLTSSRRARKSEVPHFRLNKVRNIKTWLSVRSYLMRRGPQRSVDVIVSAAFILTLVLLAFLSVEWLKDSVQIHIQFNLEALLWACSIGCFLLRFMTLGTKINRKYRSISVLITEQINLYLQIEQKPQKKEELMVANSVLKLAADLLKELDSPFKISGLSANPYLYTTVKVVILSALSGVLSEILGFKLKLHKIKIK